MPAAGAGIEGRTMTAGDGPFAGLDEEALKSLAPNGVARPYPKNVVVLNEGDATDSLYVMLSGRVKVFVSEEDGREVVVDTVGAGEYFGELVLDGGPRSASIMTLEPSRFYVIPKADVEAMLNRNPAFARDMIHKLIGDVRQLTEQVRDLALKDVYGRFVRFIEDNAVVLEDGNRLVTERLTQSDIAARIGGSREMVSRILKDLTAGNYISIDGKQITVHRKLPANW
jgi:CRP/FNR family cyclic AMP-dependent transcriptional regulator